MKIKQTSSRKKYILISLVILLTALVAGSAFAVYKNSTDNPASDSSNTKDSNATSDKASGESPAKDDSGSQAPTNQGSTTDNAPADPGYVSSPISNPPTNNDPYPIENEHYKIQQNSATSYTVTLYPIANSPSGSGYDMQLKLYKDEALKYLTSRYGSTSNFTIEWNPRDAERI